MVQGFGYGVVVFEVLEVRDFGYIVRGVGHGFSSWGFRGSGFSRIGVFEVGFLRWGVSATGFRVRGFIIWGVCRFVVSSTTFQVRGF